MYGGFDKSSGDIIGLIDSDCEGIDIASAMESTSAEESLIACDEDGDPLYLRSHININGGLSWHAVSEASVVDRTICMSQMTSMLRDNDRNTVYYNAIKKCIQHFQNKHSRSPSVLDIGTGTGLLAMSAAVNGASMVIGCEMFTSMANIATQVVEENNLQDKIEVFPDKSCNFTSDQPVDIIVSELLDSALLGESCIPSHADAIDRLLDRNRDPDVEDRVIPHSAFVYGALIESEDVFQFRDVSKVTYGGASPYRSDEPCRGGTQSIPLHWSQLEKNGSRMLTTTYRIMDVDFFHGAALLRESMQEDNDDDHVMPPDGAAFASDMVITSSGTVHGILLWWQLNLLSPTIDPERSCVYSTAPGAQNWQDHWTQVVFPFPQPLYCERDEIIRVSVSRDSLRMWFDIDRVSTSVSSSDESMRIEQRKEITLLQRSPCDYFHPEVCSCGWHMLYGSEKIHGLNNPHNHSVWETGLNLLKDTLIQKVQEGHPVDCSSSIFTILDIGDGSLLSLGLAKLLANHEHSDRFRVVSRETKVFSRILANGLVDANDLEDIMFVWDGQDVMEVFENVSGSQNRNLSDSDEEEMTMDDIPPSNESVDPNQDDTIESSETDLIDVENEEEIDSFIEAKPFLNVLISDCFDFQMNNMPMYEAINFHYQRTFFEDLFCPFPIIIPSKGHVMVAAIELSELAISHGLVSR